MKDSDHLPTDGSKNTNSKLEDHQVFRQKTLKGIGWNLINKFFTQIISVVITIILSRLLSPTEFGLLAMVTVLIGFARVFLDFGLGSALIQKKQITEADRSTVFWCNLFFGVLLTGIILLCAPLISQFYEKPILKWITIAIAFNFLISSFNVVQDALLIKALDFKRLFFIRSFAMVLAGIIAIILALYGFGVWSLVVQLLVSTGLLTLALWLTSSWRPKAIFERQALRHLFRFSLPYFGSQSLNYWVRNLDKMLIGKTLGDQSLGFYEKGYSMMLLPVRNITSVISSVMFPSLSLIQEDKEKIKHIFLKMTRVIALMTFPALILLSIAAEPFILSLLGEQWAGAIPILQVLALVGMIQSVSSLYSNIYLSQAATGTQFRLGLILKAQTITWIILGLPYGIVGVAKAYLIAVCINQIPHIYTIGKLINLRVSAYFINLFPIIICSLLMAAGLFALQQFIIPSSYNPWVQLFLLGASGALFYILLLSFTKIKAFQELKLLIKEYKHLWNKKRQV